MGFCFFSVYVMSFRLFFLVVCGEVVVVIILFHYEFTTQEIQIIIELSITHNIESN
jgi:hypothetical protein